MPHVHHRECTLPSISTRLQKTAWPRLMFGLVTLWLGLDLQQVFAQGRDPYLAPRHQMVTEFIEREGVKNPRVLSSMRQVPRHEFVLPTQKQQAYFDQAMPIGHKQTISPPYIVAYETEAIDPQPTDKVLEIGTGSGYQAAVLSNLVQEVYTIEIVEPLGKTAAERLKRLGYNNVKVKVGDGYQGWAEHAPFDKILVTCSPEDVPKPLVDQLKEGGKMIIPLGERYQQVFHLMEKKDGQMISQKLIPVLFVPMTGAAEDERKIKPDPMHPQLVNGDFETDENNDGMVDHWYYQRQVKLETADVHGGKVAVTLSNAEPGRMAQLVQGMPVDGIRLGTMDASFWAKAKGLRSSREGNERPELSVIFFDDLRRTVAEISVPISTGTYEWQEFRKSFAIPTKAREAIIFMSLQGATGDLTIDDLQIRTQFRKP